MKRAEKSPIRWPVVLLVGAALIVALVFGINALLHKSGASESKNKPAVVLVVDPAHGGGDPGMSSESVLEKNVTLAVGNKMLAIASEFPSLRVVLTRTSDVDMTDQQRIDVASAASAQLYLAVQVNSYTQPTALGIETLVDSTHKVGDPSYAFADAVQKAVVAATSARDRGVKAQGSAFSRLTIPAAATLVGFISTPEERAKLTDPTYQESIARGLLQGAANYVAAAGVTPVSATQTIPLGKGETSTSAKKTP